MSADDFAELVRRRLFDERVVALFGVLDEEAVTRASAELWTLDASGDDPVTLLCSCRGGEVRAVLSMLDVLDVVGVRLEVVCLGAVEGPPLGLLSAAERRRAAPHARFLLADATTRLSGSASEIERAVAEEALERRLLLERVASSTRGRRSLGDLVSDFERGRSLSAAEAVAYGLIDEVVAPTGRLIRLQNAFSSIGFRPPSP